MSRLRTYALSSAVTAVLLWAGYSIAGQGGLLIAILIAGGVHLGALWCTDRLSIRTNPASESPDALATARDPHRAALAAAAVAAGHHSPTFLETGEPVSRVVLPQKHGIVTGGKKHGVTTSFRLAYYAALFAITAVLVGTLYLTSLCE